MKAITQFAADTLANWTAENPVIPDSVLSIVKLPDGKWKAKLGDGGTVFQQLPFINTDNIAYGTGTLTDKIASLDATDALIAGEVQSFQERATRLEERADSLEERAGSLEDEDVQINQNLQVLNDFHIYNPDKQYEPSEPCFYEGDAYKANPEDMPAAGESPENYPQKWIKIGGTVYIMTGAQYDALKAQGKLIYPASYLLTDRFRAVDDETWALYRQKIETALNIAEGARDKNEAQDINLYELNSFHEWKPEKQYGPEEPCFYAGDAYKTNPADLPAPGEAPDVYPDKWIRIGGTVYILTGAQYDQLKAEGKLIYPASYLLTDRYVTVDDAIWQAYMQKIDDALQNSEDAIDIAEAAVQETDIIDPATATVTGKAADAKDTLDMINAVKEDIVGQAINLDAVPTAGALPATGAIPGYDPAKTYHCAVQDERDIYQLAAGATVWVKWLDGVDVKFGTETAGTQAVTIDAVSKVLAKADNTDKLLAKANLENTVGRLPYTNLKTPSSAAVTNLLTDIQEGDNVTIDKTDPEKPVIAVAIFTPRQFTTTATLDPDVGDVTEIAVNTLTPATPAPRVGDNVNDSNGTFSVVAAVNTVTCYVTTVAPAGLNDVPDGTVDGVVIYARRNTKNGATNVKEWVAISIGGS